MTNTETPHILPQPPGVIRVLALMTSVVLGLSVLPGLYLAIGRFGGFAWAWFGFEFVSLLAAVFGVLIGLGRFRNGFGIALACLTGAVLVAMVFGIHVDARTKIADDPTFRPWVNRMLMLRMLVVLGFAFCASVGVFTRNPKSWGAAVRAIVCLFPVACIAGMIYKFGLPFAGDGSGQPNAPRVISVLAIGLVMIILISAGGHLLIRAFEHGRPGKDAPGPDPDAKTAS